MEKYTQLFDVCIVCALPEEARAFLEVAQQQNEGVIEERISPRYGYSYRFATIKNNKGEPLNLHISWLPDDGPLEMTQHLPHVLEEYQPRIAIMTGICAGDAQHVQLGDLIVAKRTFTYDNGKFTLDEHGRKVHQHNTITYQPNANILQFLGLFDDWKPLIVRLERPPSPPEISLKQREVRCHIKAMASGNAVRADYPFEDVQTPGRDTVAIDMEGAAFGLVMSRHPLIPWLVVKGVCDYADQDKNDVYHDYAGRASALYALSFIRAYVTNERLPRPDFAHTAMPPQNSLKGTPPASIPQRKTLQIYRGHTHFVKAVSWSPNEPRRIASGSFDKTVQVWDATSGSELFTYRGHSDNVFAVAWSPNGKYIASGSGDGTVQVWDATNGNLINIYREHGSEHVHGVAWSPDSKLIVSVSSRGLVKVWDAVQGETLLSYPGHSRTLFGYDSSVVRQVWVLRGRPRDSRTLFGYDDFVVAVAWSPDGGRIVSADLGIHKHVKLWNAASGQTIYMCHRGYTKAATSVAWSPDSMRFASGSQDSTARVWDGPSGNLIQTYSGHSGSVNAVAWSPRGRYIASGSDDKTVRVWDALNGNSLYAPYGDHSGSVMAVAWSPDGKQIASGGHDNTVRVWQAMQV